MDGANIVRTRTGICHSGLGIEQQASVCAKLSAVLRIGKIRAGRVCEPKRARTVTKREESTNANLIER